MALTKEVDPLDKYFGSNPAANLPPLSSFASTPKPSPGLPKTPSGALNTLSGSPLSDPTGALSGLAGVLDSIPSISTTIASKSGNAFSTQDSTFDYASAFQVGGSGKQSQKAGLDSGGVSPLLYFVIAAIAGVVIFNR